MVFSDYYSFLVYSFLVRAPSLPSGLAKKKSNVSLKQELMVPLFLIEIIGVAGS